MWQLGRQNTGYKKLKIFQFLNMDCYILKYEEGDHIPFHTDPVPDRKHWRLNIILKRAEEGGELLFNYPDHFFAQVQPERIQLFRSDLVSHAVSEVKKGTRYVLTFGVAL
jgi:Rps23 Pro-64 3,4-dihydroxylase Tpa1-like proline 4-hydroxylase